MAWQNAFWSMLKERRLGFVAEETMKGTHRFLRDFPEGNVRAGEVLPFFFKVRWGHPHLVRFFNPVGGDFMTARLEGHVAAAGLTGEAPLHGTLELRYVQDSSLRYRFEFEAHDRRFFFEGEKRNIRPWNLHITHTLCRGTLVDLKDGQPLSDVEVRFDLHHLPRFLASFRLA